MSDSLLIFLGAVWVAVAVFVLAVGGRALILDAARHLDREDLP